MRKTIIFILLIFLISACSSDQNFFGAGVQLTPYRTMSAATEEPVLPTKPTEGQITPNPTPMPTIHVVALGETVSSIALKYGVTIDVILLANPKITPTALIVGDEVVIPTILSVETTYLDPAYINNLKISELNCIPSGRGLWCGVMLENKLDRDLEYPVILFSFINADGEVLLEQRVPAVLRQSTAGAAIPVVIFIENIPDGYSSVQTALFSVKELLEDREKREVIVENAVDLFYGLSASITGSMRIEMENSDQVDITVAVAAFDIDGKLVGVRRVDGSVAVNESFDYGITVYSAGGEITDVVLYVEVN